MKILVVGSGGREHAIAWKLSQSPLVKKIYACPGNAGIASLGDCIEISSEDIKGLADFAEKNLIDLTVVGPEQPLILGIVDEFEKRKLKIFGPKKEAALIEGSKGFAKEFMKRYHIPTASFKIFEQKEEAIDFVRSSEFPLVIKADGLAAGKGAFVVEDLKSAEEAVEKVMVQKIFGEAGSKVVVENFLIGEEVTILAFTDGRTVLPMVSSQDHKRIYDGDRGPNTGGMGAYAPTLIVNDKMMKKITEEVLEPAIFGLNKEGRVFKGVLYAGLMITEMGPKVIEFNCRFGDPETQVVLPLLESDLAEIFLSIVEEELDLQDVKWKEGSAVCVVLASGGYPDKYEKGKEIFGLNRVGNSNVLVFHAGTKKAGNRIITNGGRVLGVTAFDQTMEGALGRAYSTVDKIRFDGMQYRHDIGYRATNVRREYF
ncbi:MAG: phosphoribosylamine--glycine ligase [candidate division Zixibacteria bacterium]|nr:phosphoribosylamine--glycine ligase [candidate division Zixibacteria bacterium]